MSSRTALRVSALLAGVTVLMPVAAVAMPPTAVTGPVVPKINWGSCGSDPALKPFQCASVEVPTDYDKPGGATTTIALTRLPAADPAHRIGTLFTNPGGPGGPGVPFVQQLAQIAYTPQVRARFDILGFDPRGVGQSDPATCFPTAAEEAAALQDAAQAFPVTPAEERAFIKDSLKLALSCATTSPDRLSHFSTANVARDLDLLRQAVGDQKLTYIGYSYGTDLGATYARFFPDTVRALVLDGTLLPVWYSGSDGDRRPVGVRIRQGEGAAETFTQFKAECKKAGPTHCSVAALGDPSTVVEGVLTRLKAAPIVLTLPDGTQQAITYQTAVAVTFQYLYEPAAWPELADLYSTLATTTKARTKAAVKAPQALLDWNNRKEDYSSVGEVMQPCVDAKQTGRPLAYPAWADAADQRAPHFGRMRAWVGLTCEFLPIRDRDAYLGPWENKVKSPVLVIGTRHDPATPYQATRPYAELYPDARLLTVEGWGHTTLGKSACADARITEYLTELKAPADGSTCQQDRKPFDPATRTQKFTQSAVVQ
jgi:pimeloyl-ACP methyl ester carboxylesterase